MLVMCAAPGSKTTTVPAAHCSTQNRFSKNIGGRICSCAPVLNNQRTGIRHTCWPEPTASIARTLPRCAGI